MDSVQVPTYSYWKSWWELPGPSELRNHSLGSCAPFTEILACHAFSCVQKLLMLSHPEKTWRLMALNGSKENDFILVGFGLCIHVILTYLIFTGSLTVLLELYLGQSKQFCWYDLVYFWLLLFHKQAPAFSAGWVFCLSPCSSFVCHWDWSVASNLGSSEKTITCSDMTQTLVLHSFSSFTV